MAQGEQVHISSWPPMWPTRRPSNGGNFNIVAANRIRASAHCFEAKVFGIVTAGYMDKAMRACWWRAIRRCRGDGRHAARGELLPRPDRRADSAICLQDDEGIAYADIDLNLCVEPKQFHDVVGYYNSFDIFDLSINRPG